jgi:hypothetical protein
MITALLMFQLAFGLQWQVAQAVVAAPERQMGAMEDGHCPAHLLKASRIDEGRSAGSSTRAPSSHSQPAQKHDCCRSLGCQCHYGQGAAMLDPPLASATVSASLLLPAFCARAPVARTNELFRPPIA